MFYYIYNCISPLTGGAGTEATFVSFHSLLATKDRRMTFVQFFVIKKYWILNLTKDNYSYMQTQVNVYINVLILIINAQLLHRPIEHWKIFLRVILNI